MAAQILDRHGRPTHPGGRTDPWPGHLTIGQQRCAAARSASGASTVTGAIVVEAGVAPGAAGTEVSRVRAQAALHPWIRGRAASEPVAQPAAEAVLDAYRADGLGVGMRRNLPVDVRTVLPADRARGAGRRVPRHVIVLDHAGHPRRDPGISAEQSGDAGPGVPAARTTDYVYGAIIPGDGGWLGR